MKKYLAKGMKGMFKAAQNTVNYATGKTTAAKSPNQDEEEKKNATVQDEKL